MSWFLIVSQVPCILQIDRRNAQEELCAMKLVVYGTGNETEHQLFDLTHDPDEMRNLITKPSYRSVVSSLEKSLRSVVDYPRVAMEVASYNLDSIKNWMDVTPRWRNEIHSKRRWADSFDRDIQGSFKALEKWIRANATVMPCRRELVWPPKDSSLSRSPPPPAQRV